MKKQFILVLIIVQIILLSEVSAQNIAINSLGSLPDTSAMLDVSSTVKGFLTPRMTTAQQNAIPLPANGLLIFNTTDNVFKVNTGTSGSPVWTPLALSGSSIATINSQSNTSQTIQVDSAGTGFAINSSGGVHTISLPSASATARGVVNTGTQTIAGNKTFSGNTVVGGTLTANNTVTLSSVGGGASTDSILTLNTSGVVRKRTVANVISGNAITTLNTLTSSTQSFAIDSTGTNFAISSSTSTHTFNLPNASATARGLLTPNAQTIGGNKTFSGNSIFSGTVTASTLASGAATDSIVTAVPATGLLRRRTVSDVVSASTWSLTGNNNIVDGTNFIGTTTNIPLTIKVFNKIAGRIDNTNGIAGFGFQSLNSNTGTNNTAFGQESLFTNSTGAGNTAIGYQAAYLNATTSNSTYIGYQAGYNNVTTGNHFVGYQAGYYNTSGSSNTAEGYRALYANTTGSYNTAYGYQALTSINPGTSYNTAFGSTALGSNTTGQTNTAVGQNALGANTIGTGNTAIGQGSMYSNIDGGSNTALGASSLALNTSGSGNVALGSIALQSNTSGSYNMAIGQNSLSANQTGNYNTAIGQYALGVNTVSSNVGIGQAALASNTTGQYNVAIGPNALGISKLGSNKTGIGFQSGLTDSLGSNNTWIGYKADQGVAKTVSISNATAIGYMALANVSNAIVLGTSTNYVGIGIASPTASLHVKAGTATASTAPVKIDDGVLLTTIEKGTIEKDANVFYATPDATNRGLLPSVSYSVNAATASVNVATGTAVSPLVSSQDVFSVVSNTTYEFEGQYIITGMSASGRTISTLFTLATATLTNIGYVAVAGATAASPLTTYVSSATANVVTASSSATSSVIQIKGIMRVATGGTVTPQIQFTTAAPGASAVSQINSFFKMTPIGTNTVVKIGNWN